MKSFKSLAILIAGLLMSSASFAGFTYEGYLTDLTGAPIANSSVTFKLAIQSPIGCILYRESQVMLTTATGYFVMEVGAGTRQDSTGIAFENLFNSNTGFTGEGSCSYTSTSNEARVLAVQVSTDGTNFDNMGSIALRPSAMAYAAEKVGGYNAQSLVRVSSGAAPLLTAPQATELSNLIQGLSTLYVKSGTGSTGVSLPTFSGNPSTPAAGQIWFDSGTNQMKYYNGSTSVALTGGSAGAGVQSVALGLPGDVFVTGAAVTSSGTLSAIFANQAAASVFAGPAGASGTPAFRALVASDIPGLNASTITAGQLSVGRGGTGLDAATAANGALLIGNGSGFTLGTLEAGSGIAIANSAGTITISATGGGVGTVTQVGTYNGLIGGPITASGSIGLGTTGVAAGTYGASMLIPSLTVDSFGRITAASTISLDAMVANTPNSLVLRDASGNFQAQNVRFESLTLHNAGGTATISIPMGAGYSMLLPPNIGSAGQVLSTDGVGSLAWISPGPGSFPNGSVSSPAIQFATEADLGIYRPGMGNLAFVNDGTETLRITNAGYFGIGTTTPIARLEVAGGLRLGNDVRTCDGSIYGVLRYNINLEICTNLGWVNVLGSGLEILNGGNAGSPITIGSSDAQMLNFITNSTNRLSITAAGQIQAEGPLTLNNRNELRFGEMTAQGSNFLSLRAPGTLAADVAWTLPSTDGSAGQVLRTDGAGSLSWVAGTAYPQLSTTRGSMGTPAYSFSADSDTGLFSPGANTLAISTAGTMRIMVDASGKVGIGTATPSSPLQVSVNAAVDSGILVMNTSVASSAAASVSVQNDNFDQGWISLQSISGGGQMTLGSTSPMGLKIFAQHDSGYISFYTGLSSPTERIRIAPNGNVGIGTTSPTAKLHVVGSLLVQGSVVSPETVIPTGATADFSASNTVVLQSVGVSSISLTNMMSGGRYTLIIEDMNPRTYTFSGCSTSYFSPANASTNNRSIYEIYYRGSVCYVRWTTNYN